MSIKCNTRILICYFGKELIHYVKRSNNRTVWKGSLFTALMHTERNLDRLKVLKYLSLDNKIRNDFLFILFFSLK